jgi:Fe-S oxidoreductase
MHAVLDLCLECKACKSECPSGVDMAKIKYEFLAQYQAAHGVPLRSRLFANLHGLSRLASRVAPAANRALASRTLRKLAQRTVGIIAERRMPRFARRTFRRSLAAVRQAPARTPPARAVLFVDTFTEYNFPEIGLAAVRVLNAFGCGVEVVEHGCCGRPMISKGLLGDARTAAESVVGALAPYAEAGVPIIGLEPSCLVTLRDEYLDLLPGSSEALAVAARAVMIEEFVAEQARAGAAPPAWTTGASGRRVLVHGHCYQKALTGTRPLLAALRLAGWEAAEIAAGCCGLAGSFGYETEHYALSRAIAEDRLWPAVRAAPPETVIAASGVSCRSQIEHGTGRKARHPAELLADALA